MACMRLLSSLAEMKNQDRRKLAQACGLGKGKGLAKAKVWQKRKGKGKVDGGNWRFFYTT